MVKVVHDVAVVCRRLCLEEKVSAGDFFGCGRDLCWFMAPFLLFPNYHSKAVTKAAKQIEGGEQQIISGGLVSSSFGGRFATYDGIGTFLV